LTHGARGGPAPWLGRVRTPSVAAEWADVRGSERWQVVDGTLCLMDISDSTALFERLAAQGRIAGEELTTCSATCSAA
jgi:hypothetical protein